MLKHYITKYSSDDKRFALLMWISSFAYWYEQKNKESLTCFLIGVVLFISAFG